jgi:hypothetical protein
MASAPCYMQGPNVSGYHGHGKDEPFRYSKMESDSTGWGLVGIEETGIIHHPVQKSR